MHPTQPESASHHAGSPRFFASLRQPGLSTLLFLFVIVVPLCACKNEGNPATPANSGDVSSSANQTRLSPDLIALNNRGVAEMGRFEYAAAEKTFARALKKQPDETLLQLNHLIALLNRQQAGDEETALRMAEKLAAESPQNLQAPYIAGLLHFNQGRCEAALPYFERVVDGDPSDAYALYFSGQCLLQQGKTEAALQRFQQSLAADGYLRSAYYSAFMAAQQLGQGELAEKLLAQYQKLQANPQSRLAEIKYTRMGPKAEVRTVPPVPVLSQGVVVKPPYFSEARLIGGEHKTAIIAANLVDFQQDGHTSLVTLQSKGVFLQPVLEPEQSDSTPSAETTRVIPLENGHGFTAMVWGDVDNDGSLDVLLIGQRSQLWLGTKKGFQPAQNGHFGLNHPAWRNARLADADHDGDLDILAITESGQFVLWNNNLDGSWRSLNAEKHIPEISGVQQIVLADVDADRDLDIVLRLQNGLAWLQNDRMWHYRLREINTPQVPEALALADLDSDGLVDWLFADNNGVHRLSWDPASKKVTAQHTDLVLNGEEPVNSLLAVDVSGDGSKEVLLFGDHHLRVLDHQLRKTLETHAEIDSGMTLPPLLLHTTKGPELLLAGETNWYRLGATDNRAPFVLLGFTGEEDKANSVRSNKSGIGVKFTAFAGDCASTGDTWHNDSASGQNAQPVSTACGMGKLDFIAIHWPDGVYQTEQNLEAGRYYRIAETQRQLSSCPVIFLKHNGEYRFESDVLGVGGIGFAIGKDEYGQPRPWENYLVPAERWSAENGLYSLLFTEPMEEAAYLDSLSVNAIDVPGPWQVVLDERMQTGLPEVTGQPVFYRQRLNPNSILRQDGQDVTELGLRADKRAIEPAAFDARFMGFADGEQSLTLTFDAIPEGDWVLLMRGWVEYGYSQTGFAAWQAGLRWQPPSIDVFRNGHWQSVVIEAGYPAGMPRLASIPLGQAVVGAEKIRIRSNQELYLDELALVKSETPEQVTQHRLPLSAARLFKPGFPQRQDGPQRLPEYDYQQRKPFWDTRYMQGHYTRLGAVKALLEKTDNALAIIGPGEAIETQFTDTLPPLKDGWRRYFVLEFAGWAKDMDLMTKDGETLAPIPHNGPVSAEAQSLNRQYNIRFQHGR